MALLNRCLFNVAAGGTGSFTVTTAVTGYQTPAETGQVVDGETYEYAAQTTDLSQWEGGEIVSASGGTSFARTTVLFNSEGTGTEQGGPGTKINFSSAPQVMITALVENFLTPLNQNTDFYYSSSGNDSNPGTFSQPFKTIQGGLNAVAAKYDINGFVVSLIGKTHGNYAGFTFPSFVSSRVQSTNPYGIGVVRVVGDTNDATTVTINAVGNSGVPALIALLQSSTCLCNVDSLTVDGSTIDNGSLILSTATGQNGIVAGDFDFTNTLPSSGLIVKQAINVFHATHIFNGTQQGRIDVSGDVSINGSCTDVFHAEQEGLVTTGVWKAGTVTAESGLAFTAFAGAGIFDLQSGQIQFQGTNFVDNGATGKKFEAQGPQASVNLFQQSHTDGLNALPGDTPGTCQWGGSYGYWDENQNFQILVGDLGGTAVSQQTYLASQLPTPDTLGDYTATVTDALSPSVGATVVGGGFTICKVWWDNSVWRVMAIGTAHPPGATLILSRLSSGVNSGSPTPGTTTDAPAGSLIVAFVANANAAPRTITNLTDSAGNPYTQGAQTAGGSAAYFNCSLWYCSNTAFDLPAGGTFTATTSDGSQYVIAAAVSTAINGADQAATNSAGTGTGISVSTGALAQANEIVFGISYPSSNIGTFTEDSNFTSLIPTEAALGHGDFAFQVVAATTAVTYAPSWSLSSDSTALIVSFKF